MAFGSRHACIQGWHFHVFARRFGGNQMVTLEHEAECLAPQPGQFIGVQAGHVLAGKVIAAITGPVQATQQMHQGRLARAGSAHDSHKFTGRDRQADAAQHFHGRRAIVAAVALAQSLQFDQGRAFFSIVDSAHSWNLLAPLPAGCSPVTSNSPSRKPSSTSAFRRLRTPTCTVRVSTLPSAPCTLAVNSPAFAPSWVDGFKAGKGTASTFLADAVTNTTCAVICGINSPSALSTSNSTVYKITLLLDGASAVPLLLPPGTGGAGSTCRTLPLQRRCSPPRVVKYTGISGRTLRTSASDTSVHTVMADRSAMRRIFGVW